MISHIVKIIPDYTRYTHSVWYINDDDAILVRVVRRRYVRIVYYTF